MSDFPYAERFPVNRRLPERGRRREEVLAELTAMAQEEDAFWETGKCSGTMYSGDHDHYRFLNEAFGLFAHVNVLQRDMCPSATKLEGEIIAMALDLMHADAVEDSTPAGLVTSGGTDSILHAMLAYREHAALKRGLDGSTGRPNIVKPETAHPAFDKAARLLGLELRAVPVTGDTTVDPQVMAKAIDDLTIGIVGSAGNYGYGTIDPIADLGRLALDRGVPLHVDGCLGGFILPFGEQLGLDIAPFDFRVPGVTTISADTHKYGYSFKGTSTLLFRDKSFRNAQYFELVGWSGGKYMSPGIAGSRSGGLLAATWAAMVQYGREGYLEHARAIFSTADRMQDVVRSHPELRIIGSPTFCFSFTSDVVRHLPRRRLHAGARLALQRPAVPERHPHGGDRPADPARRGRAVRDRPRRGGALRRRPGGGRSGGAQRRHLRRGGRRADERGRGARRGRHDRHARHPAVVAAGRTVSEPARRFVLAVDLGTGGPKVGLVSTRGEIVWWDHQPVVTRRGPGGAATQDAEEWWRLVCDGTRKGLADAGVDGREVAAVAVTGQWASTVPVDAAGVPVGECVMWMDSRGRDLSRAAVGGPVSGYDPVALATWVRRSGGVPSTNGDDPLGHLLFVERDQPEVARRARWYLEPVDYLTMRLTGIPAASHMSMTAAWLTDNRRLDVLAYDPKLLRLSGVAARKLPPLVASGSLIGPVQPSVAGELGISPSAQVVTGLPDLHGSTVGSGFVGPYETHLSIGTTGWIGCPLPEKKTDVIRQLAAVPGLGRLGGAPYLLGNNQESAGRCLQWFRDTVGPGVSGSPPSYAEITALAATSPAGSRGVVFTPWLAGERSPVDDRSARGGFHDVSVTATTADLARSVLEGVAFNARWLLAAAEHFCGRRLDPLRLIGGGAQSELWCRIVADVCDRTVERVADPLLCGLRGAGLAGALALGDVDRGELRQLVPLDGTFRPDPAHRAVYDQLYAEFPRLYRAQRRMFHRLNA